jgi:hypothetical protein
MRNLFVNLGLCAGILFAQPALAGSVSTADRSGLQAAMFQHIDRNVVNGVFRHVDLGVGKVEELAPAKAHPMILRMGEYFVLCTDFRNKEGKSVNIDFYVARHGKNFVIFQTEVNNRGSLEKLMKEGKVAMID